MLNTIIDNHNYAHNSIPVQSDALDIILEEISAGGELPLQVAYNLLNLDILKNSRIYDKVIEVSRKLKYEIYKNEIFPVVPLYVTSICEENCIYCNYRRDNNKGVFRTRLTNPQLAQEVSFLIEKGYKVIELVYSSDPCIKVKDICGHIEITHRLLSKSGGGMVGINAWPFSFEDYKQLKASGLDFSVLWQETYDLETYKKLHFDNLEKSDFFYRFDAYERMINAGINNIGIGVLSGLSDWRKDWYFLLSHVDLLLKKYDNRLNIILGIPRLKPAVGALLKTTPFVPNDREYIFAISIFNLFLPRGLPFVNTRERWDICLDITKPGGTIFTFDCKTTPGGYSLGSSGHQFPTFDFGTSEHIELIKKCQLHPRFDWTFDMIDCKRGSNA